MVVTSLGVQNNNKSVAWSAIELYRPYTYENNYVPRCTLHEIYQFSIFKNEFIKCCWRLMHMEILTPKSGAIDMTPCRENVMILLEMAMKVLVKCLQFISTDCLNKGARCRVVCWGTMSLSWFCDRRSVGLGVGHPFVAHDQIFFPFFCRKIVLLSVLGRTLWREDGSVSCSAICQWSESRRTHKFTLLSHLRLLGSLSVASYDSQGLRWKYSNPPPQGDGALCYKLKGCWFDSRLGHLTFQLT
jgi:hypothetical protein